MSSTHLILYRTHKSLSSSKKIQKKSGFTFRKSTHKDLSSNGSIVSCVLLLLLLLLLSLSLLLLGPLRTSSLLVVAFWWLFPPVRGFGENVRQLIPRLRFFFKVEISSRTLIPRFRPGSVYSGSASWDDCDRVFPDELRVTSFPDGFPHYVWTAAYSAHCEFVGSKVYACLGVTCHLHFWENDRGLLRATAVTRGWNGQQSQHTKLTLEKKILRPLLPGLELTTFRSRVRRSNQQAITASRIGLD